MDALVPLQGGVTGALPADPLGQLLVGLVILLVVLLVVRFTLKIAWKLLLIAAIVVAVVYGAGVLGLSF